MAPKSTLVTGYQPLPGTFDEFFREGGVAHPSLGRAARFFDDLGDAELRQGQRLAGRVFVRGGVTFSVYSDRRGVEKIFPFDVIPRVVSGAEWERLERDLEQRLRALNLFLGDVYGEQRIIAEGRVPRDFVEQSEEGWRRTACSSTGACWIRAAAAI